MSTVWALKRNRPQSPHLLFRATYTLRSNHSALHKVAQVCRRGRQQLKRKERGKEVSLKKVNHTLYPEVMMKVHRFTERNKTLKWKVCAREGSCGNPLFLRYFTEFDLQDLQKQDHPLVYTPQLQSHRGWERDRDKGKGVSRKRKQQVSYQCFSFWFIT